ncbi:hypothetical protein [Pseudoxanthomonas sp.]|jgi:hypothetical protein|uniref:hypothetical protein n=1 Tax=Pseudoxanthomonas sp. TaxID=1871049 RepID=UPI002FE27545
MRFPSRSLFSCFCLLLATPTLAQNQELASLYEADQAARSKPAEIDWTILLPEDRKRRERVLELMRAGAMQSAVDYYHAAMVYQHGQSLDDFRLAHALSTIAMSLEPEEKQYRWLTAASWDRIMASQLQPQWYGTQSHSDDKGMFLYPVADDVVTDEDRKAMQVPTLAETRARLKELAEMHGQTLNPDPPTIDELRKARRAWSQE